MKLSGLFSRRNFFALGPAFPAAMVSATLTLKEHGRDPIELDVSVLKCQPGDVLVLRTEDKISMDTHARLGASIEAIFPGLKCIVLADGLTIEGVLRPDA